MVQAMRQIVQLLALIRHKLKRGAKQTQGRVILLGLAGGLFYLPTWTTGLLDRSTQSTDGFTLATIVAGLGLYQLWKERRKIAKLTAGDEDRLLGNLLIFCSIGLLPFCQFAIWPQAFLWLTILIGIVLSLWGVQFFARHRLVVCLLAMSVYPKLTVTAKLLWEAVTPYKALERTMAEAAAFALRGLGQPAQVQNGTYVAFPTGSVDVYWGCNGFDMALTMMATGLIMGLFLKQSWQKILMYIVLGALLALLFNVPRVMLLAVASVYWGKSWFDFWHGPWGGQIFSGALVTVYYYAVMGLATSQQSRR